MRGRGEGASTDWRRTSDGVLPTQAHALEPRPQPSLPRTELRHNTHAAPLPWTVEAAGGPSTGFCAAGAQHLGALASTTTDTRDEDSCRSPGSEEPPVDYSEAGDDSSEVVGRELHPTRKKMQEMSVRTT